MQILARNMSNFGAWVEILDTLAGIFTPILTAITGAGILNITLALFVILKVIDKNSHTYSFLSYFADAAFYFLPFLIANSAAKKMKCNPYMVMSLAACLLHPKFTEAVTATKADGTSLAFLGGGPSL